MKVQATYQEAQTWSYLFLQQSGKYYFYFINAIEYVSDECVQLTLELDLLQTYMFDFTFLPSFIERQHVTSDEIGEHTVDEGLETGEYIDTLSVDFSDISELVVLVMSTAKLTTTIQDPNDPEEVVYPDIRSSRYHNIFGGMGIYAFEIKDYKAVGDLFIAHPELTESIVNMWMYPKALIKLATGSTWDDGYVFKEIDDTQKVFQSFATRNNIDGYVPKNNKVLCYPYNFLYVTNNAGNTGIYRFERFEGDTCEFTVTGALSPDGAVKMYPEKYNGIESNYDAGITLSGFPTCAWGQDAYKIWLAQNQNSQNLSLALSGASIAGGVATSVISVMTGNPLGAVGGLASLAGGASKIAQTLAMRSDKQIQPPQSKGTYSAHVNVVNSKQTFSFVYKSVNREHAQIIDDYFTMYGYKVNRVATPNIKTRKGYTYVKTIGCHISANFCNEDIAKIESIFDNGVTYWVKGDQVGDYTVDNTL